jgi:hypothetical protein
MLSHLADQPATVLIDDAVHTQPLEKAPDPVGGQVGLGTARTQVAELVVDPADDPVGS